jgi:hypothetical protein
VSGAIFQNVISASMGSRRQPIFVDSSGFARLQTDDGVFPIESSWTLLRDLDGEIAIKDADGNGIATVTFNSKTAVQHRDGRIMLAGLIPFPQGEYVATIRVHSGAPALADKQQEMYSEYELCGIEQLPASIAGVFAFAAGIIGLVSVVCVLPGLLRCGICVLRGTPQLVSGLMRRLDWQPAAPTHLLPE